MHEVAVEVALACLGNVLHLVVGEGGLVEGIELLLLALRVAGCAAVSAILDTDTARRRVE